MWVGMNDMLFLASAFLSSSSVSVEGQVWGELSILFIPSLLQGRGPSSLRDVGFWCFGLKFPSLFLLCLLHWQADSLLLSYQGSPPSL